ncbi:MAG: type II secretion system F family protein, partial [Planctomycetales bacterium]|nr:type II secretion system F family protein [Planctomycetales bacterium]
MPNFAYTARDRQGKRVSGTLAAGSEREVISLLAGKSLFPLQVQAEKRRRSWGFGKRVSGQIMAVIYSQLSGLLRSGVPLLRSLEVLRRQSSNDLLKHVLQDVHDRVEDGATLAEAMRQHPRVFGELPISMVRAGGEGGFLEDALER